MTPAYEHRVQYYETDQMKIVHHSNYIRWFEEARTALLREAGFGYERMEEEGLIIPVVEAHAAYRSMVHFGDTVLIQTGIKKFNGAVLELSYQVTDKETGALRCQGQTKHCFLDQEGRLISLKYAKPGIYRFFKGLADGPDPGKIQDS